jgi:hypothetical protein
VSTCGKFAFAKCAKESKDVAKMSTISALNITEGREHGRMERTQK